MSSDKENPIKIPDLKNNADQIEKQKQYMMDNVEKKNIVDILVKQNSIISQQSTQMIDMVNLINEFKHGDQVSDTTKNDSIDTVSTLDTLAKRNDMCRVAEKMRKMNTSAFEQSVRIQFILFALFIIVMIWLVHHYISLTESK